LEAAALTGSPFSAAEVTRLEAAFQATDDAEAVEGIQRVLDPHCLVGIQINPESRVKVTGGPAKPELVEHGWRQFLVKVQNEAGITAELRAEARTPAPSSAARASASRWGRGVICGSIWRCSTVNRSGRG
jgi:hypothetical protein